MAGSPKKRERHARAVAAAAAATGIHPDDLLTPSNVHSLSPVHDAQRLGAPPQAPTRPGAPTRARTRGTPAPSPGKLQLGAVDELAMQQMQAFADALAPECTVRIERLRPTFAAGVCEDFLLDAGELAELIEHVREEYGGQRYKLTLLSANGTALQSTKLNVPGAPKHEGRRVTRSFWTGDDEPRALAGAPVQNPSDQFAAMTAVLKTFAEIMGPRDNSADTIAAVREIAAAGNEQTHRLIRALATRDPSTAPKTLREQMAEVIETQRAFGQLRDAIVDVEPGPSAAPAPTDDSMLSGALKQMATQVLMQGWQNSAAARGAAVVTAPSQPQQQQPPSQQPSPPTNVRRVALRRAE